MLIQPCWFREVEDVRVYNPASYMTLEDHINLLDSPERLGKRPQLSRACSITAV